MTYAHSLDQALEFAKEALAIMDQRTIAPTPNNFTVWFTYASGERPDLNRALSILLDSEDSFSPARSEQVFKKFCTGPYEAVPIHLIAERMEAELATVLSGLAQTGRSAAAYGKTLETVKGALTDEALANGTSSVTLIEMVSRVLDQTRAMRQQSQDIERQLKDSVSEVSRLRDQLDDARREAMTDTLTCIANRKMFDFVLRQAIMDAIETFEPLCLLMLDIDHFKQFNDSHGHHVGDQVLRLLASVLTQTVKGQDTPARYGGEEFTVVLPQTRLANALKLAEAIRERVSRKSIINRKTAERLGTFTVSIGVAQFRPGEPPRYLIERADAALYTAKRGGRNRVESETAVAEVAHAVTAV